MYRMPIVFDITELLRCTQRKIGVPHQCACAVVGNDNNMKTHGRDFPERVTKQQLSLRNVYID